MTFNRIKYNRIIELLEFLINEVRDELRELYDVERTYKNYQGLCDRACAMLEEEIKRYLTPGYDVETYNIHGEQKHTPRIHHDKWSYEHTWMKVKIDEFVIYVDPTSSQFKDFYNDIPDYYISRKRPKWYYPDDNNPLWRGITNYINENSRIFPYRGSHLGIVEYFQYVIWGNISDIIGHHKK